MNELSSLMPRLCTRWSVIVTVVVLACTISGIVLAADPAPAAPPKAAGKNAKKIKKELSGAELYAIHCNRCHPERYAPERIDVQWKTILTHMRVRANLPARQAQAILKFLQEDSGK